MKLHRLLAILAVFSVASVSNAAMRTFTISFGGEQAGIQIESFRRSGRR